MAASLSNPPAFVDAAPGNTIALNGSGLTAGAGASVVLQNQGAQPPYGSTTLVSTFSGSAVSFVVPDGAMSGPLLITASDGSTVTATLRVSSQYVQAAEYVGEGVDTSGLAPAGNGTSSELDAVLRKASAYADTWMAIPQGLRQLQTYEQHRWNGQSRKIYPFRFPVASVDAFTIKISNAQQATINVNDVVSDPDQRYVEILSYAVANYVLLGAIQNLGLTANIVMLTYTSGYPQLAYPPELRAAVMLIATELLDYRFIQAKGLGGFGSVRQNMQQYDRRSEPFAIPAPAKELLRPFIYRRLA